MRRLLTLLGLLAALALAGTTAASAHVIASTGYATVTQDGSRVNFQLSLEYAVLVRAVDLGEPATDDGQRAKALDAAKSALETYLHDRVIVSLDGAACEPELATTSVGNRAATPYAELGLTYACAGDQGTFRLQYKVFADSEAVADDHTNLVEYHFGDDSGRTVFDRSHHDFTVGDSTMASSSLQFGKMGVEHILLGLDHVLFVVALILGAQSFKSLLQVTSMFTVAHSVTLVSTLLGGITVGIETGQALLLLAVFPLVLLIRRSRVSVPVVRSATGVVAAFGTFWFVERFFLT
jgi:hypothetical protein